MQPVKTTNDISRARTSGEAGFTLPELVISLGLLAFVMMAVAQMFIGSLRTASASAHRTDAVGLAERDVEAMRSIPYAQLGFSSSQGGFSSTFVDGATTYNTVQVAQPQLSPAAQTVVLSGVAYVLTRTIYWVGADRSNPANFPEAYKQTTVTVAWTDDTGSHQVRQEGIVYPGGQGAYVGRRGGTATTTTAPAGTPFAASLSAIADTLNPSTTIVLNWIPGSSPPVVDHWIVQYSSDSFITVNVLTSTLAGQTTTYRVNGLAPSSLYQFRVGAVAASGGGTAWSNTVAQSTTSGSAGASCTVTKVTLTPTSLARASGSQTLQSNIGVAVTTTGPCTSISARYTPTTSSVRVYMTPNSTSTSWSGSLDGVGTNWALGDHIVTIWNEVTTTPLNSTAGVTVTP